MSNIRGPTRMSRKRIFCLLGNNSNLTKLSGDVLNERKFYRVLSEKLDVFYNGEYLSSPDSVLSQTRSLKRPADIQDFDYYYIRNSPEVSSRVDGPLLLAGYPRDPALWSKADAIVVTNNVWADRLENLRQHSMVPRDMIRYYGREVNFVPPVIVAEQHYGDEFASVFRRRTELFKLRLGAEYRVGFIGRIDETSIPNAAIEAVKTSRKRGLPISLTFVGPNRGHSGIPSWIQVMKLEPYENMPSLTSAFDALIYDQDESGNWLGSGKVLEALARGIPILVRRHEARVEQLGSDYPLYYDDSQEFGLNLERLVQDGTFRESIVNYLVERRAHYSFEAVASRFWGSGTVRTFFSSALTEES